MKKLLLMVVTGAALLGLVSLIASAASSHEVTGAKSLKVTQTELYQLTGQQMQLMKPKNSVARNKLIMAMITNIAREVFDNQEHAEFWIALIGVESGYEPTAVSEAGAVGLGQLLPKYATDFGKGCGLAEVSDKDVFDSYTNAYLSACYFRELIRRHGSIPLALTAYNSGSRSWGTARAKQGEAPAVETSNYISKTWLRKTKAKKEVNSK